MAAHAFGGKDGVNFGGEVDSGRKVSGADANNDPIPVHDVIPTLSDSAFVLGYHVLE